jgi:hypothetical protein
VRRSSVGGTTDPHFPKLRIPERLPNHSTRPPLVETAYRQSIETISTGSEIPFSVTVRGSDAG